MEIVASERMMLWKPQISLVVSFLRMFVISDFWETFYEKIQKF